MMKIPMPVWASFTTGRPELLVPLRAAVANGELLTQEEQVGLLEALSEAVKQAQALSERDQELRARLKGFSLHLRGGEKLLDELLERVS